MAAHATSRRATITDVAQLAGVSISTVSRVVNGTAPVAEETVQVVRSAITQLRYVPLPAARALAGQKTDTIGLLLPEIGSAFFPPLLRGIERGVRERGFDLLIHASSGPQRSGSQIPLAEHNTDGLLVFTNRLSDGDLARLWAQGTPMVLLYRSAPHGLEIPCVKLASQSSARRLMEHLIDVHDCRRIVFMAGLPNNEDSMLREAGYREALESRGLPFDPTFVVVGNYTNLDSQRAVSDLLRRGTQFDAVFAADDESAAGVMFALRQAGRRVPEDIAVVGFDDVPFATFLSPPLTTMRARMEEVGCTAVRLLIGQINGAVVEQTTLLETELVVRQSCGCL